MAPEHELDPATLGDHFDRLSRAAWALCGSREDAEDLVQETYARVLARLRFLRSDDDLGYLLRALRNTFLVRSSSMTRPACPSSAEAFALVDPNCNPSQTPRPTAANARPRRCHL